MGQCKTGEEVRSLRAAIIPQFMLPSKAQSISNDVDEAALDDDGLADGFAGKSGLHFLVVEGRGLERLVVEVGVHGNAGADLAVDLHGDFDLFLFRLFGVVLGPGPGAGEVLVAECAPELLDDVRREGPVT